MVHFKHAKSKTKTIHTHTHESSVCLTSGRWADSSKKVVRSLARRLRKHPSGRQLGKAQQADRGQMRLKLGHSFSRRSVRLNAEESVSSRSECECVAHGAQYSHWRGISVQHSSHSPSALSRTCSILRSNRCALCSLAHSLARSLARCRRDAHSVHTRCLVKWCASLRTGWGMRVKGDGNLVVR